MPSARLIITLLGAFTLAGCDFLRGYAEGHSNSLKPYEDDQLPTAQMGAARFLFEDFGALNTDTLATAAVPWKLVAASLVIERYPDEPATQAHLTEVLTSFGFFTPQGVGNWPLAEQPTFRNSLGIVTGTVERELPRMQMEVANLSCAACHAGTTYDADGIPQRVAWLGLPNTSVDLDAYAAAVLDALRLGLDQQPRVFAAIKQLFPDVSEVELATLRKFLGPELRARIRAGTQGLPVRNGGPGRSNDLEALELQFHLRPSLKVSAAGVSIPAIGGQGLHWSVLADGMFTRPGDPRFQPRASDEAAAPARTAEMAAFFSLPALGLQPERTPDAVEPVTEVLDFLANYQPPRFPGAIDEAAATRGAVVYARCAECHGEYVEREGRLQLRSFPNRRSSVAEIGTDAARLDAVNIELLDAIDGSPMGRTVDAAATRGYVAPSLAGIWATAPYLHNGSVPTLAALMTPSERPAKFWVGGHKLDMGKLGIAGELNAAGEWAYPAGFAPWSTPRLFDTSAPGHSNRGHEREFDGLTAADKADLIEFMKQL